MGLLDILGDALVRANTAKPEYGQMSPELAAQAQSGGFTGGLLRTVNPMMFDRNSAWNKWTRSPVGTPMGEAAMKEALPVVVGTYAGPNAKTADLVALAKAEQLAAGGAENEAIRQATGWFKGMDGKWRFEIDDSASKLSPYLESGQVRQWLKDEGITVGDTISHSSIYAAYPDLAKLRSHGRIRDELTNLNDAMGSPWSSVNGMAGGYSPREIFLNTQIENARPTMLHELQHAIQDREGFARGGDPQRIAISPEDFSTNISDLKRKIEAMSLDDGGELGELARKYRDYGLVGKDMYRMEDLQRAHPEIGKVFSEMNAEKKRFFSESSPLEIYKNLAGEIEARDVADRMNMTQEQRKATPPKLVPTALLKF